MTIDTFSLLMIVNFEISIALTLEVIQNSIETIVSMYLPVKAAAGQQQKYHRL